MTSASHGRSAAAPVRLLAIDPGSTRSSAQSGAAAFATRRGVRVGELAFLVRDILEPSAARLDRAPRRAPFGAGLDLGLGVDRATSEVVATCAFVGGPVERGRAIVHPEDGHVRRRELALRA